MIVMKRQQRPSFPHIRVHLRCLRFLDYASSVPSNSISGDLAQYFLIQAVDLDESIGGRPGGFRQIESLRLCREMGIECSAIISGFTGAVSLRDKVLLRSKNTIPELQQS
jgi:hypothetical protein